MALSASPAGIATRILRLLGFRRRSPLRHRGIPAVSFRWGDVAGIETRAIGHHIFLAPGINLGRISTLGRNFEYFGEDPVSHRSHVGPTNSRCSGTWRRVDGQAFCSQRTGDAALDDGHDRRRPYAA